MKKKVLIALLTTLAALAAFAQNDSPLRGDRARSSRLLPTVPVHVLTVQLGDDGTLELVMMREGNWWDLRPATAEDQAMALREPESVRDARLTGLLAVTGSDASGHIVFRSIAPAQLKQRDTETRSDKPIHNPLFIVVVPEPVQVVSIEGWQPLMKASFDLRKPLRFHPTGLGSCPQPGRPDIVMDQARINIVVVSEGYLDTPSDRSQFQADYSAFLASFLRTAPFNRYAFMFNIQPFFAVSCVSGAFHPKTCPPLASATESRLDWPSALRTTYCGDLRNERNLQIDTHAWTENVAPYISGHAEMAVVLVNDLEFGGSGGLNSPAVIAVRTNGHDGNLYASKSVLHELGHLTGLADEYLDPGNAGYAGCGNNCEPNVIYSPGGPPAIVKWNRWLSPGFPVCPVGCAGGIPHVPGLFQGARYITDYWRSENECLMHRSVVEQTSSGIENPPPDYFCHVCTDAMIRWFYRTYNPLASIDVMVSDRLIGTEPARTAVPIRTGESLVLGVKGEVHGVPDLKYTWRDGFQKAPVIPGESGPTYTYVALSATTANITLEITDPTTMVREDDANPEPVNMHKFFTWQIASTDPLRFEIHKLGPIKITIPFTVPQGTENIDLRYSVQTSEVGRSGDQWHITVGYGGSTANALTAQQPLFHIEKTASNPQDNVTDQVARIPIGDAARNGPVTVVTEIGGTAGETGDQVDLPTVVTSELSAEPTSCVGDQCDYCQGHPTDPSCPFAFSMSAEAVPIASTSRTYNGGDSTYSSLGERIHEGRYVNITIPSPVKQSIQSIHFTADAVRTADNVVLGRVRDTVWVPGGIPETSGVDDIHETVWALNISPKVQYVTENPSILNPIPEDLWTHTIKYRITATITGLDGRVATSSTEVDSIISGSTPSDPVLLERPLHALWHSPYAPQASWHRWTSIYMSQWLKFSGAHMPLHIPDRVADEDAVNDTPPGHEFASAITEVPFYPNAVMWGGISYYDGYSSFRATAAKALDSNPNAADRTAAQGIVLSWLTQTRAHLQTSLPDISVSEIVIGDGGRCGHTEYTDHLPEDWMKTLLLSGKVLDGNGNSLLDLSTAAGDWNPPYIERLFFSCVDNADINILLDRCRIGELPFGPCSTGRTIITRTSITTPPVSTSISPGQSAYFSVIAVGENLRYQWYQGAPFTYTAPLSGEMSDHLTVTPTESTSYWVLVTGDNGADGAGASVTINGTDGPCTAAPVITSQPPVEQYVNATTMAFLAVDATGENRHYQWYQVDWYGNLIVMDGATYSSFTTSNQGNYIVRVSNACGSVDSTVAYVMAGGPNCAPPTGMYYGASSTGITVGQSITLGVLPQGTPPVSVSWFQVLPSDNIPTPVGTDPTITVTPPADQTQYFATLGSDCGYLEMQPITINVCTPPAITQQPVLPPPFVLFGQSAMLTVQATGTNLHYHWTASGAGYGTDSPTLVIAAQSAPIFYYCTVSNDCGTVDSISVTVDPPCLDFTATVSPDAGSIVSGQSITLAATSGGTGGLTYQWLQKLPSDSDFTVISGATGTSLVVSPTVDQTQYKVRVTNCRTVESNIATVTVTPCLPPSAISLSGGGEIVRGQSTTLFASSTGTGITYQWYLGSASDTSTPIYNGAQSITVTPQSPTNYWVRVTGACGSRDGATVTVSVCDAPTITSQPQGLSVFFGATATLSVTATVATATPVTYQWYIGDSGTMTSPISDATSSSYTTPPLTTDTSYWVAVSSDICGPTLSDAAIVSICPLPPTMPAAPDQTIRLGQTAHVELSPFTPPTGNTFFWYQGASGDTSHPLGDFTGDWGPYDYVDVSPTVTTQYWAQIKNGTCIANTGTTTVNVCIPTITAQPAGTMINSGQSTTLTVAANTTGLTYQWYTGMSGNTSSPISGATNASYVASPTVTTSYWVRVTGICAQSADSNTATVTICQPPSAISLSGGGEIVRGQTMTLSASSTGTGITYQWYLGSASDTSNPIYNGAQSITVTPQSLTNYWVRVSGTCGSRDSATVTVNVCAAPTITSQPQSASIFSGNTATLSVSASVATATPLTYQWYIGASGTTTSPISGATGSSYTTPALNTDTSYWVSVSSDICGPTLSDAATVSICPLPPTMTGAPSQSISLGQTAHMVIPPFSPSTGDTFFWYQGAAGDTSHPLGDYSGDWGPYNYLDVSPAVTTQYWAQIKNGTCIASTGTTTISVCIPTITQQPAGLMINSGQTTTLTVAANTAGLTYHWYQGASGTTSVPVGTNSPTFTTPALTTTTSYWVLVTGTCGQSASSSTATVTICQTPAITVQPAGTSLVRGYSTTLSVSATGTGLSYQWYLGTSGNTTNPLAGNTNSYAVTNPQNPVDYWVKVSGTCGTPVNSATAHISVCTTPTINTQPQSSYTFSGGSATLSVSASEATGETLHYQWHKGTTSPVNVGTDSPTYNTGALSANTSYYVTVTAGTAGLCSVDSAAATVSICTYPQTVTGAPNANTSPGQSVRLTIASNPGVTSYLWYRGVSGDTTNPMGGWQAANYVDVAPTTTTSYWAQWQADSGSCISNTTTTTVSVCIPVITTQPANVTIASGSTTLSVVSNLPGSTYQWYIGASGTTTSPISGATSASVTVSPATTTSYWCRVSGSCATANSNTATVTICSPPVITHQPANSVAQSGQTNVLSVTATGTNLTYQWYMGASGDTSNPMSGRTTNTLQNNLTSSVQYWVKVSGTCGSVNSSAAWMSVPPGIISQPQQTTYVAQGSKGNLFVNAVGTGLHYQWWGDSGPVAGAPDSPNFISPDVNATADYYCIITSSGGGQTTSWTGTFYLCSGVPISSTTVTNAGGNCRNLISNVGGSYANMTWFQGQRGDTSVQVGTNYYLSVCPSTSTTYWFRVYNTDSSQGVSCYTDSAATTVP